MKKQVGIILSILLILSLGVNIYQGVRLQQNKQSEQELLDTLCREVAYKCAYSVYCMDAAIEHNDRPMAHTAGMALHAVDAILRSKAFDARVYYEYGFSTVSSLLLYDNPSNSGYSVVDFNTPLSNDDIQLMKELSKALEEFIRTFMADTDFPLEDYNTNRFDANIVKTDIDTLNQALETFDRAADTILDSLKNAGT